MGKYEVTQGQWQQVMGKNPSKFAGDAHPVEQVSWHDVQEFLQTLNDHVGKPVYRLPSEAEWEYAARAGTQTAYSFGNDADRLSEYAWYSSNSGFGSHPVGQLKPNAWGRMLGDCMICTEMWGSGARTGLLETTTRPVLKRIHWGLHRARTAFGGVAPGSAMMLAGQRTAA
jgi:hypothetical protein